MFGDHITAYIGLGSNLGDRAGHLLLAVRGLLEASFDVTKLSAIYETEPIGLGGDAACFLNMAAEVRVRSDLKPSQMMARLLRIEYVLGRRDKSLKKPRTIDLDILFFGRQVIETPFVTVPHPRLHLRRFVLVPMAEIAPSFVHPVFKKDIQQLLGECGDTGQVSRWNPGARHDVSPALIG
ncbi:MAG: 2-amino-4-hydroxy-6-hydroxymethyldihydropteridine diphosphokinase [Pyrinomonadaceae bacterium]